MASYDNPCGNSFYAAVGRDVGWLPSFPTSKEEIFEQSPCTAFAKEEDAALIASLPSDFRFMGIPTYNAEDCRAAITASSLNYVDLERLFCSFPLFLKIFSSLLSGELLQCVL